jgi:DNA-binding MarR family transcriptional regulator
MKKTPVAPSPAAERHIVLLPCACANVRRASRIVSQLYDRELRPAGLRVSQFTLLQALVQAKDISQGRLGEVLGLDSTTLTRTLALLRRKGWIQAKPGKDRRQVRLALTVEGMRAFQRAKPYWQSAQRRLRKALGDAHWNSVNAAMARTAAVVRER